MAEEPQQRYEEPDKVPGWRLAELVRLFPDMPLIYAQDLAVTGDHELLARARWLASKNCPHDLAYRIMRAL